jgi:ketosteroid isomerase-like protein
VTTREVVESFWSAMTANDWERAAAHLADDAVVDWPCSGERIARRNYAEIQARYPAAAKWRFDLHRVIVEGEVAVTELTVTDGKQTARAIVFSEVADDTIIRQIEYWLEAYEPPAWRADLVERIEPVP